MNAPACSYVVDERPDGMEIEPQHERNGVMAVTFRTPTKISGMVLPAGTYVLKLAQSDPDYNIVQVFNKDGSHLYGTFRDQIRQEHDCPTGRK